MITRTKGIFSTNLWKPKQIHSLDYLKYLHTILLKNTSITEQNKELLVEIFRLLAEILIWGDQNDSSIIDFFLEKNILSLFLKFLNQDNGKMIYKQLLQTLSIMFENISDNTSIYYLLSNNHINAIICHKFDFEDDEVMAYYISFLKALSMKLNKHTINFFYNEHTNDFALLNESIKFSNQSESMVRTAVRNITLNVYKNADKLIIQYIRDRTAVPYFDSLMWSIGNRIMEIDLSTTTEMKSQNYSNRVQTIIDEHLDHLHYVNDILCLGVGVLNEVLIDSLLNKLYLPLFVYSLTKRQSQMEKPHVSIPVAMFMLAQVFVTIKQSDVVQTLANIVLTGDWPMMEVGKCIFEAPAISLVETLENIKVTSEPKQFRNLKWRTTDDSVKQSVDNLSKSFISHINDAIISSAPVTPQHRSLINIASNNNTIPIIDITNEDESSSPPVIIASPLPFSLDNRSFLRTIFQSLHFEEDQLSNDYEALPALCLIYAICHNEGISNSLLDFSGLSRTSLTKSKYNYALMDRLIRIFNISVKYGSTIRLVTLELACTLAEMLVCTRDQCWISDEHFAYILAAYEESKLLLRNYYRSENVFVEMFEYEYSSLQKRPLDIEYLLTESIIMAPDVSVNVTDFAKKLPSNDIERARYTIRVFLLLRQLCDKFKVEDDPHNSLLTLDTFGSLAVSVGDKLDLSTKDLMSCTIEQGCKLERKFMVIDDYQMILIDPDAKRAGWGVVVFAELLQHVHLPVSRDNNSKSIVINWSNRGTAIFPQIYGESKSDKVLNPILDVKLIFDDHARCSVAHKRLEKGREISQQLKLQQIALLLDFPTNVALGIKSSPSNNGKQYRSGYFGPKEAVAGRLGSVDPRS